MIEYAGSTDQREFAMPHRTTAASEPRWLRIVPNFFDRASELREVFDERFRDPRCIHRERFLWDYWHIPDQYTYIRTHAERYFPASLYGSFLRKLRLWGEENLGCWKLTPLWLSYYVDGCVQELHADVPHGPWAVVYSLTRWGERKFTGGETVLLRPALDRYWSSVDEGGRIQKETLVERIPSHFDQLLVFDPRIPHGVSRVEGVREPRDSRVVLHGWFQEPSLRAGGGLDLVESRACLEARWPEIASALDRQGRLTGLLVARLELGRGARILTNTVVADGPGASPESAASTLVDFLGTLDLRPAPEESSLLVPVRFSTSSRPSLVTGG